MTVKKRDSRGTETFVWNSSWPGAISAR